MSKRADFEIGRVFLVKIHPIEAMLDAPEELRKGPAMAPSEFRLDSQG